MSAPTPTASPAPTRPALAPGLGAADFGRFYWLKSELLAFCRTQGLPLAGGKLDLARRIAQFLRTGEKPAAPPPAGARPAAARQPGVPPTLAGSIPPNCRGDEAHRAFFRQVIGPHFRFTVGFLAFLRSHAGHPYAAAITEWQQEHAAKKAGRKTARIAPQFEYNQFVRDYRASHPGRPLADVVAAWKRRRDAPGPNTYQPGDAE